MTDLINIDFLITETADETVNLSLEVELGEAFSNTNSINLLYWKIGGDQTWITLNRDLQSGSFIYFEDLNRFLSSGEYQVRTIRAVDNYGDEIAITNASMQELGFITNIFLENSKSDNTPPVIESLKIGEFIFDEVSQLWSVAYELIASDDLSGLQAGHIVEFLSPSGTSLQEWRNFDQNGEIVTSRYFGKFISEGDYRVNTIRVWDNAGNYTQLNSGDLDKFGQKDIISLESPYADNIAPELSHFSFDVIYNEEINRPSIVLTFKAIDEGSGYNRSYIRLWDSITHHDRWIYSQSEHGDQEIIFKINLTQEFIPGEYRVGYFNVYDLADNRFQYQYSTLEELGFSPKVNIYFKTSENTNSNLVEGSSAGDWVFGDNSNDQLFGGAGDDVLYAGDGDDIVNGGSGSDLIIGGNGKGNDTYNGGTGIDTIKYTSATAAITVNLTNGSAKATSGGDAANIGVDSLTNIENVISGKYSDRIIGSSASNRLEGNNGNDLLYGQNGNDKLYGGNNNDRLYGGSGNDRSYGEAGNDSLYMDAGNDTLDGGSGTDWLYVTGSTNSVVNLAKTTGQNTGYGTDIIKNIENASGGSGVDKFYGTSGNNTLKGNNGNDLLYGQNGNDTLYGGNNNDRLYGGSGNDTLRGDAGRDILQGDAGKDALYGGADADTFVFRSTSDSSASASSADIIRDFTRGSDKIDLHYIDASTKLSGNNAFTFDGTKSFGTSKEGDIYYKQFNNAGTSNDYTMVYIDTDNDTGTEMSIKLMGLHTLTADDFIL